MKIGAGGLQSQAAQDMINARQAEQTRQKLPVHEEVPRGQQKVGPEINKPVYNTYKSAELNSYLKNKETSAQEKKTKRTRSGGKDNPEDAKSKTAEKGKYPADASGSLLDEYK